MIKLTEFERYLAFQKDLAEATLKTINKYMKQEGRKNKRMYNQEIVKDILVSARRPLHISEIIKIAQEDFNIDIDRDSIVSALAKKVKSGQTFTRTAPNTFSLIE